MSAFNRWSSGNKNKVVPPRSRSVVVTADPVIVYQTRAPVFTPLPKNKQAGFTDVAVNLLLTTLAVGGAVQPPFYQTDWPNPSRPAQVRQVEPQPNLLLSTLAQPFRQSDWPNPPKLRPPLQPEIPQSCLGLNSSKDIAFRQQDWPNPKAKPVVQPNNPPNLLCSTLSTVQAPFVQLDWPNPKALKAVQPDVFQSMITLDRATNPFKQTEWPNPAPAKTARIDNPPNLLGTTLAPAAVQAPFKQLDWPNPIPARKAPPQFDPPNLQTSVFVPVPVKPFNQYDWPNPKLAPQILHELNVLRIFPNPFFQTDWPNPPPRKPIRLDYPPNITILLSPGQPPFKQTEWPNPALIKKPPIDVPQNLTINLPIAAPFVPIDWPVAKVMARAQQPDPPNLLPTTLFTASVQLPFNQYDWPLPPKTSVLSQPDNFQSLIALDRATNPFRQTDWPLAKITARSQQPDPPNLLLFVGGAIAPTEFRKLIDLLDLSVHKTVVKG